MIITSILQEMQLRLWIWDLKSLSIIYRVNLQETARRVLNSYAVTKINGVFAYKALGARTP